MADRIYRRVYRNVRSVDNGVRGKAHSPHRNPRVYTSYRHGSDHVRIPRQDRQGNSNPVQKLEKLVNDAINKEIPVERLEMSFAKAKEQGILKDCEELIFANDSCYAPLHPFDALFESMSSREIDFWGATQNIEGCEIKNNELIINKVTHLQSYFIVFKPSVFLSEVFDNFVNSITKQKSKQEVIAYYEVQMTAKLSEAGFKYDVYSETSKFNAHSQIFDYKDLVVVDRLPFIKRNVILLKEMNQVYPLFVEKFIKRYTSYDYELILRDKEINQKCINIFEKLICFITFYRKQLIRIRLFDGRIFILGKWYDLWYSKKV